MLLGLQPKSNGLQPTNGFNPPWNDHGYVDGTDPPISEDHGSEDRRRGELNEIHDEPRDLGSVIHVI